MPSTARRLLLSLATLAIAWGVLVILTGGFAFSLGPLRVASHAIVNPLLVAVLAMVAAAALPANDRWRQLRADAWQAVHPARVTAAIGIFLFVYQWGVARPLWLDEQMIALNVRERSLRDLASGLWLGQSAPFGWLAAERAALIWFGDGERAMRLIPVLFAVATIVAAWWTGRRWMGTVAGTLLVLLFSFGQWVTYYSLELKHYSADIFWALLLPAMGAWAIDAPSERTAVWRGLAWWVVAALGQWLANGALLVTPGVALAVAAYLATRRGPRTAFIFAAGGSVWLAAFALHYFLAIRHALGNAYLEHYWAFALPPAGAGGIQTVRWLIEQARPIAIKPGGASLWLLLWLTAIAGFAFARARHVGVIFATVPLSAAILATLRLVPLYERISLWVVPALYVGVALSLDAGLSPVALRRRQRARRAGAVIAIVSIGILSFDVVRRGVDDLRRGRPAGLNHRLDDRSSAGWLTSQLQPGDVVLTTRLALPALWWYGHLPISDAAGAGGRTRNGDRILQLWYEPAGPRCRDDSLDGRIQGARRALVLYGFRFDDVPATFDDLLLRRLSDLGLVTDFRNFNGASRAAVVELRTRANGSSTGSTRAAGCIVAVPARRW